MLSRPRQLERRKQELRRDTDQSLNIKFKTTKQNKNDKKKKNIYLLRVCSFFFLFSSSNKNKYINPQKRKIRTSKLFAFSYNNSNYITFLCSIFFVFLIFISSFT